jgi:hypothetical protein
LGGNCENDDEYVNRCCEYLLAEEDKSMNVADMNKAMQPLIKIYETQEGVEQLVFKETPILPFTIRHRIFC